MKKKDKDMLIGFVLDETGSMEMTRDATISGFNEYIQSLKKQKGKISFVLTQFNSYKNKIESYKDLKSVPTLDRKSYSPNGMTPLYDAVGGMIKEIEGRIGKKKVNVLVVIMTDGLENYSKEYTRKQVFDMVEERKDWTFVFLGANQDSWAAGGEMGIKVGNIASYDPTQTGKVFSNVLASNVRHVKSGLAPTANYFSDEDFTDGSLKRK